MQGGDIASPLKKEQAVKPGETSPPAGLPIEWGKLCRKETVGSELALAPWERAVGGGDDAGDTLRPSACRASALGQRHRDETR